MYQLNVGRVVLEDDEIAPSYENEGRIKDVERVLQAYGTPLSNDCNGRECSSEPPALVHPDLSHISERNNRGNNSLTTIGRGNLTHGIENAQDSANSICGWVNNHSFSKPPYFLTAVFYVRIYENDKSELTTADIIYWLEYLRYAGVEHVYMYDNWRLPGEQQRELLDALIGEGFLTYTDWTKEREPYVTYTRAYQHCIDNYGSDSTWQVAIDIDEYPFSPSDAGPGFLHRFLKKFSREYPSVSEITMLNYLHLGMKDHTKKYLFAKLWRHMHGPSNEPIYKPSEVNKVQLHHNVLRQGLSRDAPREHMRLNHYWGARLQNWGPDTDEILEKTEEDRGMEPIVAAFRKCDEYIRPYLPIG